MENLELMRGFSAPRDPVLSLYLTTLNLVLYLTPELQAAGVSLPIHL